MPWPPRQPARSEFSDEAELKAYEEVVERARNMGVPDPETNTPYYGQLLHAPLMSAALSNMGRIVRAVGKRRDSYSHADREWSDQVLAIELGTEVVQGSHLPDAIISGVRIEAIDTLRHGREEELTEDEALLTAFIRKALYGKMDGDTWNAVERRMGERGVMEYFLWVLYLQFTMRAIEGVSDRTPASKEEIDQLVEEYKSGKREITDEQRAYFKAQIEA